MSLFDCIFGPALYRIFEVPVRNYEPYTLERYTDRIIRLIDFGRTFLVYSSPIFAYYTFYRSESTFLLSVTTSFYFKFIVTMTSIYFACHIFRGFSRSLNPNYVKFIRTFKTASFNFAVEQPNTSSNNEILQARDVLRNTYDFQFCKWPVNFKWSDGKYSFERPAKLLPTSVASQEVLADGPMVQMVSWMMAHSIGRILLYPGSLKLFHKILEYNLITGRHFLIENYHAQRYKLLARDNNTIDSIFVDRRKASDELHKGNNLVICSDGNAAFYEFGILTSLLSSQYSLMGWNHPGFADSSGSPFPQNDINAMEVVINFAVTELGFPLERIILFAWSIGGFPVAWAASNYPEVKGIVIDASFDDILPLARSRMMPFLAPIVDTTIRNYFNLNLSAYLKNYNGPIRFIRRLQDEILTIDPRQPKKTNQGNNLLVKLLANRFPCLMSNPWILEEVKTFLYSDHIEHKINSIPVNDVVETLQQYIIDHDLKQFPLEISLDDIDLPLAKHIIWFLCSQIMTNFNTTHCTPLPSSYFKEPLDLFSFKTT